MIINGIKCTTQLDAVLQYMKEGKTIDQEQAYLEIGTQRLGDVIFRLRGLGYNIKNIQCKGNKQLILLQMDKPNYYAIIPAGVRYSEIKPNAKLLYGEITALTNKKGYCFASNNYFAELFNVNKNTISLWIKELKDEEIATLSLIETVLNN